MRLPEAGGGEGQEVATGGDQVSLREGEDTLKSGCSYFIQLCGHTL